MVPGSLWIFLRMGRVYNTIDIYSMVSQKLPHYRRSCQRSRNKSTPKKGLTRRGDSRMAKLCFEPMVTMKRLLAGFCSWWYGMILRLLIKFPKFKDWGLQTKIIEKGFKSATVWQCLRRSILEAALLFGWVKQISFKEKSLDCRKNR